MKSLQEVHKDIADWHADDCVGNLTIFKAPRSDKMDIICEQVIKLREMDRETQNAVRVLFDLVDSERVELFRDKNGYPDRIKVIRRI